jgi:hypothetical protein
MGPFKRGRRSIRRILLLAALLAAGCASVLVWQLRWRLLSPRRQLLWLWLLAALAAPIGLDLVRGTFATAIPRYAIAGLPAALILVGLAISRLPRWPRGALLGLVLVAWVGPLRDISTARFPAESARLVATTLQVNGQPGDLIVLHSIPSGILTLSRYLDPAAAIATWVGQLGQRQAPTDLLALGRGAPRLVLVDYHTVGDPPNEDSWLRAGLQQQREVRVAGLSRVWYFATEQAPSVR